MATTLRLSGGLSLSSGAVLDVNLAVPNPISTTVNLTPTSDDVFTTFASFGVGTDTINITNRGIPASVATGTPAIYQLITASSQPNLNGVNFTVNGPLTYVYSVVSDAANDSVDLIVSKGSIPNLTWVGSPPPGGGKWDIGATAAWVQASAGVVKYTDGANLTFDDTPGTANTVVSLNSTVQPGSIAFNNSLAVNYTFNGTGNIAGTTGFTKQNTGSVTFNTVNTASGIASITNGSVIVGATGALNNSAYNVTGGSLTVNGSLTEPIIATVLVPPVITNGGVFTLNPGGSITSTATLNNTGVGQAVFNENATLAGVTGPSTSALQIASGKQLTVAGTSQFDGVISGNGNLSVASGVLTLSNGGNSYGSTGVTGGSLVVTNASGSATGPGAVHVFSGGALGGTGIVAGAVTIDPGARLQGTGSFGGTGGVTVSGILSPAGLGTTGTINLGTTTITAGAELDFDLGAADGSSDVAVVNGALTLNGTETVKIEPQSGFKAGDYILATATSLDDEATFDVVVDPSGAGYDPSLQYYDVYLSGENLVLTAAVPEPGSLATVLSGLGMLVGLQRFRRKAN
jgi:hypothetical protein